MQSFNASKGGANSFTPETTAADFSLCMSPQSLQAGSGHMNNNLRTLSLNRPSLAKYSKNNALTDKNGGGADLSAYVNHQFLHIDIGMGMPPLQQRKSPFSPGLMLLPAKTSHAGGRTLLNVSEIPMLEDFSADVRLCAKDNLKMRHRSLTPATGGRYTPNLKLMSQDFRQHIQAQQPQALTPTLGLSNNPNTAVIPIHNNQQQQIKIDASINDKSQTEPSPLRLMINMPKLIPQQQQHTMRSKILSSQIRAQTTMMLSPKTIIEDQQLQTRRLDSLIQLIQKDLDKTKQVAAAQGQFQINKVEQKRYIGLSKNKQSTVKDRQVPEVVLPECSKPPTGTDVPLSPNQEEDKPTNDIKEEKPLSLMLLEAFRLRLFIYGTSTAAEGHSDEAISELHQMEGLGESLLWTFLSYLHISNKHETGIDGEVGYPTQMSSSLESTQTISDTDDIENYINQQMKSSEKEEGKMAAAQMDAGVVSYSQKLSKQQQQPTMMASQQQQKVKVTTCESIKATLHDTNQQFSPRGTLQPQSRRYGGNKKPVFAQEAAIAMGSSSRKLNHFSIDKMPKMNSANRRNNILSNSLQILQVPSQEVLGTRNASAVMNGFVKVVSGSGGQQQTVQQQADASGKGLHLRYVSQGMHRSTSIASGQQSKYLNSKNCAQGSRKINVTQNMMIQGSKEQNALTQVMNERVSTQQLKEKTSRKNVDNAIMSSSNSTTAEIKIQRSLLVQSNKVAMERKSSIVNDGINNWNMNNAHSGIQVSPKVKPQFGTTMTQNTSEYGVVSSKQELQNGEHDISGPVRIQKRQQIATTLTSSTASNRAAGGEQNTKNVPLIVNSRMSAIPNDYLISNVGLEKKGVGAATISSNETVNVGVTKQPNTFTSSFKQMPSGKNLITLSGHQQEQTVQLSQRPQGRGDKLQSKDSNNQRKSSKIFQPLMPDRQVAGVFNKQSLEKALKTAQMGASQRNRGSDLDPSYNGVWDAPLSQKLEFINKTEGHAIKDVNHSNAATKTCDQQLVLLHNITPGQGRKPDFRQSTALPKSYKQFVATVNSGFLQQQKTGGVVYPSSEQTSMYKTTTAGFGLNLDLPPPTQQQQQQIQTNTTSGKVRQSGSSKKQIKRSKKDDILRMINQLEVGESSDAFRSLAKQFYQQNLQITQSANGPLSNQNVLVSMDGNDCGDDPLGLRRSQEPKATRSLSLQSGNGGEGNNIKLQQKQLWQQFQLLRILKQTKYQQSLDKCQSRGEGTLPGSGPPGSQSVEYGFDMNEEQMYKMLFANHEQKNSVNKNNQTMAEKDEEQPYASFDCPECVQMASLMLEEELKFYQERHFGKRKGKSRDAMQRGHSISRVNGQPLKGIAGLSMKNQSNNQADQMMFLRELHDSAQNKAFQKRQCGQTQQLIGNVAGSKRIMQYSEPKIVRQIIVNNGQQQVVFKKQVNPNFRQVVRGEQMTQHMKADGLTGQLQQVCVCRSGPYQPSNRGGKVCVCGASNPITPVQPLQRTTTNYDASAISGTYSAANRTNNKTKKISTHGHGGMKGHSHAGPGQEGGAHLNNGVQPNAKNALDGTVQGHKRRYKPANGIYQPPLQPFKHLAQSPINQVITKVNELVLILFKQRIKGSDQQIIKLFKYFGIPIPRGNGVVLDNKAIRMPDFQHTVNQKLLIKLYKVLNHENGGIQPEQSTQIFRFYIGKGNNYPSVRQIIARRTWWNRGNQRQEKFYGQKLQGCYEDDFMPIGGGQGSEDQQQQLMSSKQFSSGCHFIWTQWRKTDHHEFLKRVTLDRNKVKASTSRKKQLILSSKKSPQKIKQLRTIVPGTPLAAVPTLIYNRLDDNYHLSNKKALFLNISTYYRAMGIDPFEVAIPLTFNVKSPQNGDSEYTKFTRAYQQFAQQKDANIWIIKPGENSNRGTGIQVASNFSEIRNMIQQLSSKNGNRTSIVQKYLDKPLLIHNRKFDIRGYALITSVNGKLKGYMYRDCYFRTSSKQFDLSNLQSRFIHLTNDAIQMGSEDYGRFESGNKLSINDFQRYLDQSHGSKNVVFMRDLFPQMERLVTDSFRAVGSRIDPLRLNNCFEIFGYDFMIDENFKVFMIEANTNPSLEICSPLLARIVPELLDNSFRIAIDPLYQPAQFLAKLKEIGAPSETTEIDTHCVAKGAAAETQSPENNNRRLKQKERERSEAAGGEKGAAAQPVNSNAQNQKRQRLEMLTQIKYTLVYDERIDKPVVDKILADYEQKQRQAKDPLGIVDQKEEGPNQVAVQIDSKEGPRPLEVNNDQNQLFLEIVEEEKLDEQAAINEEIEAAENEEAGILPQPLILQPLNSHMASEDEEEDEGYQESEEDIFN